MNSNAVIALDLGGTKLAAALFASDGRPIGKRSVSLDSRTGEAVGELITGQVKRLRSMATRRGIGVAAVGVCVPGIANPKTGRVWAPNISGWEDYPLRAELRASIADKAVKVVVDSDRGASILGEAWQGAARGCHDAVFLAVGTGIGAGVLVDGRVVQGAHGIAGAIGWMALERPYRREFESCGCFETYASGEGIAKSTKAMSARRKGYRGSLRTSKGVTAHDVFAAYEDGDTVAKEVVRQAIEFWGMASANLVSLFNPEKIIFGGGVFGPAAQFLDAIAAEARRWAQPVAIECVKFESSQLGSDAALYGAAYLAMHGRRIPK